MDIPVSIVLFFLLSGLFLFALLTALQRSKKAAGAASGFLVAVVLVIVLAKPVQLWPGKGDGSTALTTGSTLAVASSGTTDSSTEVPGTTDTSATTSPDTASTTSSVVASTTTSTVVTDSSSWEKTFEPKAVW